MRFFLHGDIHPETQPALVKHEHAFHVAAELSADAAANAEIVGDPTLLLAMLQKKQWQLITTDSAFVQKMYDDHIEFPGIIVLLLEPPAGEAANQPAAIDRLFERYPRLTPRRLYTVTPNRVKIRQLPGAAQA